MQTEIFEIRIEGRNNTSYLEEIVPSLLRNTPELLAWIFGIILAVLMVRRGGGKAEKLLLAGCSLIFATNLANPLLSGLVRWLGSERGMSNIAIAQTMSVVSLPGAVLGLAGLVCLVYAFWLRFRARRQELA